MKLRIFSIAIIYSTIFFSGQAFASQFRGKITKLLRSQRIKEAKKIIIQKLKENPRHVDAIMMMGNIVVNEYLQNRGHGYIHLSANMNETIYDRSIGSLGPSRRIITLSKKITKKVASYWLRCIRIDSKRLDIYKGLCWIYSLGMMKNNLIQMLWKMKRAFPRAKLMYTMGDYACKLMERNMFNAGLDVYKVIIKMYPKQSGIYSDVAGMCSKYGKIKKAVYYVNIALNKGNHDRMVYNNYAFINLIAGNFNKTLQGLKRQSRFANKYFWLFFKGILRYSQNRSQWKKLLRKYLRFAKESDARNAKYFIRLTRYLVSRENRHDFKSFLKSVSFGKLAYAMPLLERAVKKFPRKFKPVFIYADFLSYMKYYTKAIQIFKRVEQFKMRLTKKQKERYSLTYGWCLQSAKKPFLANKEWRKIINSNEFFIKSAARYFYGRNLLSAGKKYAALKVLKVIVDSSEQSKYVALCSRLIYEIKGKQ